MLSFRVIKRAQSQYINPLVLVIKKDNTICLRIDAQELNKQLMNDHDGAESLDEVLRKCTGIGIMSSIDLTA